MRYSFITLGQYVKVYLEPPHNSYGSMVSTSNARPILLRIVSLTSDNNEEGGKASTDYMIGDSFTKFEIHLSYQTLENPLALPQSDISPHIVDILDYKEFE
jgi:hypothetical protein